MKSKEEIERLTFPELVQEFETSVTEYCNTKAEPTKTQKLLEKTRLGGEILVRYAKAEVLASFGKNY